MIADMGAVTNTVKKSINEDYLQVRVAREELSDIDAQLQGLASTRAELPGAPAGHRRREVLGLRRGGLVGPVVLQQSDLHRGEGLDEDRRRVIEPELVTDVSRDPDFLGAIEGIYFKAGVVGKGDQFGDARERDGFFLGVLGIRCAILRHAQVDADLLRREQLDVQVGEESPHFLHLALVVGGNEQFQGHVEPDDTLLRIF